MLSVESSGSFDKTMSFLNTMESGRIFNVLDRYGRQGVDLLASATPRDTGLAASSWGYQIGHTKGIYSISWLNTDVEGGVNVAIIIQYGHGTRGGGYVQGRDYINPALRPLFDRLAEDIWRQVTNA